MVMRVHACRLNPLDDWLKRLNNIEERHAIHAVIWKIEGIPVSYPKDGQRRIARDDPTLKIFRNALSSRTHTIGHKHQMHKIALRNMPRYRAPATEHLVIRMSSNYQKRVMHQEFPSMLLW
jgi:hypothetical protein